MSNKKKIENIKFNLQVLKYGGSEIVEVMSKKDVDFLIEQAEKLDKIERWMKKKENGMKPDEPSFDVIVQQILQSEYKECSVCEEEFPELISCGNCHQDVCNNCSKHPLSSRKEKYCQSCQDWNTSIGINILD